MSKSNLANRIQHLLGNLSKPVSLEGITETLNLDPDYEDTVSNSVAATIFKIRQEKGAGVIITTDEGYIDGLRHATSNDHGRRS